MRISDWSADVCSSDLAADLDLEITGAEDGYRLAGHSSMREISRDPDDLVRQSLSEHHYPDGFVLFLGTLFAPTQDRDEPGRGFTHKIGDRVSIATPRLGTLVNHRSEEHTSELQSLMRISYAVFCLKKN